MINEKAEQIICQAKGLITQEGKLTDKAITILDDMEMYLVKTKKVVAADVLGDDFLKNIQEYRMYFPSLLEHGPGRQSVAELKKKFVWFFKTYPEYDWPLVLEAAKFYCYRKSLTNNEYMTNSSHFIKKEDSSKDFTSQLAALCQTIIDDPSVLMM